MDEVDLSLVKREIETERDANNPPPKRQRVESLAQQLGSELRGIISEVLNGQLYQVIKRSGHYPIDPETSSQFGIRNVKRACDKVHHSFLHDWISNIDRKLHTALLSTEGAVKDEALMEMSLECLDGLIDKVRPQFAGIHERCLHIVQYCVKCMTSSDQSLFPRFSKAFCEALRQRFDQWTDEMVEELGKEVRAEMGNPFLDDGITFADLEVPKPTGVITHSALKAHRGLWNTYEYNALRSRWVCEKVRRQVALHLERSCSEFLKYLEDFFNSVISTVVGELEGL